MAAIAYGHDKTRNYAIRRQPTGPTSNGRGVNFLSVESKTLAERRAWEIMDAAGRHDDLAVTINPSAISRTSAGR
jgi:hypothetical protein